MEGHTYMIAPYAYDFMNQLKWDLTNNRLDITNW